MQFLGHDHRFWMAVIGAAAFKVWTSQSKAKSIWAKATTGAFAVFCPVVFTDDVLMLLGWGDGSKLIVAALLTLTGEGIMRWVTGLTPERAIEIWKEFKK